MSIAMYNALNIKKLLDKCEARVLKGVQFYCSSSTCPAILLLVIYFIAYNHRAIYDISALPSEVSTCA